MTTRTATLGLTEIREDIRKNYDDARRGIPVGARRAHDDGGVVWLDMDLFLELVDTHEFTPEVYAEGPEQIGIWLPQFGIYGIGSDLASAEEDLLEEVRVYLDEYLGDLTAFQSDPVRKEHYPHVLRATVAEMNGALRSCIFGDDRSLD